jgi:D-glycero-D-manno-heptose 1,7-bisphosphate phosphatase
MASSSECDDSELMQGRAVFFDRDGVLNRLILNPATDEFESPHRVEDLQITANLDGLLRPLQDAGYSLFLVSNQPSYAKGKTSMEALQEIHAALDRHLKAAGIVFREYYYCFHHPESRVAELLGPCSCRKPSPYFLEQAISAYHLDRSLSWMVGDQDSDVECGKAAGLKTVLLEIPESLKKRGASKPDEIFPDLQSVIPRILK